MGGANLSLLRVQRQFKPGWQTGTLGIALPVAAA